MSTEEAGRRSLVGVGADFLSAAAVGARSRWDNAFGKLRMGDVGGDGEEADEEDGGEEETVERGTRMRRVRGIERRERKRVRLVCMAAGLVDGGAQIHCRRDLQSSCSSSILIAILIAGFWSSANPNLYPSVNDKLSFSVFAFR